MISQRKEITKRVRNRLLFCVALFISCGMGFLILLDSRHPGNEVLFPDRTGIKLVEQGEDQISNGGSAIVYSCYRDISVLAGTTLQIETFPRPQIWAYKQPELTLLFNFTLDFSDGLYYDIRFAQLIPDVNQDGYTDIVVSIANTSSFSLTNEGNYRNLVPTYSAYYNLVVSGKDGTLFGGSTPQQASFCDRAFTKLVWVDFLGGNKITSRDGMPDLVGLSNVSDVHYAEAYHLDVEAAPPTHLAWSLNGTVVNASGMGYYDDLILLNSTFPNDVVVLVHNSYRFLTIYARNGSYGISPGYQKANLLQSANYDFTGDGTEEVLNVDLNVTTTQVQINTTIIDVVSNTTLSGSHYETVETTEYLSIDWGYKSHANATQPGGYRTGYFWLSAWPQGEKDSLDSKTYVWRVHYQTNGIQDLNRTLTHLGNDRIQDIVFTKFNSDNHLDLGLLLTTWDGQFDEFAVYDGGGQEKLESFTAYQSFSGTEKIIFIQDFGGDGKPDMFMVQGRALVIGFETLFFWQQSIELTVMFVLCIVGFIFAVIILLQWRKALRYAPITDGTTSPEELQTNPQEAGQKKDQRPETKRPPLFKTLSVLIIALAILTVPMILFLRLQTIGLPMQAANVRLVHILTFVFLLFYSMIPVVAVLYNVAGPIFATSIFMKTQAAFIKAQPGKHDYRVLVLDYGNRQKRSVASYLTRSLFPILLACAVGVNVFNTFNTAGAATGFTGSAQMQEWILSFEIWCSLPIIVTFAVASFIVPSGWLLDDAGVVYFVENLQFREPGDVSKISEWFLRYIKAIAGFTALLSYFSLFGTTNFLVTMDDVFMSILMTIDVFAFIVLFPFLGGFVYMLVAQITVENNLPALKQKLYQRMNAMGLDTTPRQLRDVLDPKDRSPREFEKMWEKVKLPRKEKQNRDTEGINPPPVQ